MIPPPCRWEGERAGEKGSSQRGRWPKLQGDGDRVSKMKKVKKVKWD